MMCFRFRIVLLCVLSLCSRLSAAMSSADSELISTAAFLSSQSYCEDEHIFNRDIEHSKEDFIPVSTFHNATKSLIGLSHNKSSVVILIRGFEPIVDWIISSRTDLVAFDKCKNCKVNKGFIIEEHLIIAAVKHEASRLRNAYPHYRIVVAGHSLGAAVATIVAADLTSSGFRNVSLITFGSPRVGNAEFASWASSQVPEVTRVTHFQDFAPHFPSEDLGYQHLSGEVYEDEQHHLTTECRGHGDPICATKWSWGKWPWTSVEVTEVPECDENSPECDSMAWKWGKWPWNSLDQHAPQYFGQNMHCDSLAEQSMDPVSTYQYTSNRIHFHIPGIGGSADADRDSRHSEGSVDVHAGSGSKRVSASGTGEMHKRGDISGGVAGASLGGDVDAGSHSHSGGDMSAGAHSDFDKHHISVGGGAETHTHNGNSESSGEASGAVDEVGGRIDEAEGEVETHHDHKKESNKVIGDEGEDTVVPGIESNTDKKKHKKSEKKSSKKSDKKDKGKKGNPSQSQAPSTQPTTSTVEPTTASTATSTQTSSPTSSPTYRTVIVGGPVEEHSPKGKGVRDDGTIITDEPPPPSHGAHSPIDAAGGGGGAVKSGDHSVAGGGGGAIQVPGFDHTDHTDDHTDKLEVTNGGHASVTVEQLPHATDSSGGGGGGGVESCTGRPAAGGGIGGGGGIVTDTRGGIDGCVDVPESTLSPNRFGDGTGGGGVTNGCVGAGCSLPQQQQQVGSGPASGDVTYPPDHGNHPVVPDVPPGCDQPYPPTQPAETSSPRDAAGGGGGGGGVDSSRDHHPAAGGGIGTGGGIVTDTDTTDSSPPLEGFSGSSAPSRQSTVSFWASVAVCVVGMAVLLSSLAHYRKCISSNVIEAWRTVARCCRPGRGPEYQRITEWKEAVPMRYDSISQLQDSVDETHREGSESQTHFSGSV